MMASNTKKATKSASSREQTGKTGARGSNKTSTTSSATTTNNNKSTPRGSAAKKNSNSTISTVSTISSSSTSKNNNNHNNGESNANLTLTSSASSTGTTKTSATGSKTTKPRARAKKADSKSSTVKNESRGGVSAPHDVESDMHNMHNMHSMNMGSDGMNNNNFGYRHPEYVPNDYLQQPHNGQQQRYMSQPDRGTVDGNNQNTGQSATGYSDSRQPSFEKNVLQNIPLHMMGLLDPEHAAKATPAHRESTTNQPPLPYPVRKYLANMAILRVHEIINMILMIRWKEGANDQASLKNFINETFAPYGTIRYTLKNQDIDVRTYEISILIFAQFVKHWCSSEVVRLEIVPQQLRSQVLNNGTIFFECPCCTVTRYFNDGSYITRFFQVKGIFDSWLKLEWLDLHAHSFIPGVEWSSLERLLTNEDVTKDIFKDLYDNNLVNHKEDTDLNGSSGKRKYAEMEKNNASSTGVDDNGKKMRKTETTENTENTTTATNQNNQNMSSNADSVPAIYKTVAKLRSKFELFKNINSFGTSEGFMRLLQVNDVMQHLKNLMLYQRLNNVASPLEAMFQMVNNLQAQEQQGMHSKPPQGENPSNMTQQSPMSRPSVSQQGGGSSYSPYGAPPPPPPPPPHHAYHYPPRGAPHGSPNGPVEGPDNGFSGRTPNGPAPGYMKNTPGGYPNGPPTTTTAYMSPNPMTGPPSGPPTGPTPGAPPNAPSGPHTGYSYPPYPYDQTSQGNTPYSVPSVHPTAAAPNPASAYSQGSPMMTGPYQGNNSYSQMPQNSGPIEGANANYPPKNMYGQYHRHPANPN